MTKPEVTIEGLGVAGSLLAAELASKGFVVRAFEPNRSYVKPCGEQLTLEEWPLYFARKADSIKTLVRRVDVAVSGRVLTSVTMSPTKWAIVDKPRMIHAFREWAQAEGALIQWRQAPSRLAEGAKTVIVDARGPYVAPGEVGRTSVLAVRVLARVRGKWEGDLALLDFWPRLGGLFWVFPYDSEGNVVNAGTGFVGVSKAEGVRAQALAYLRYLFGDFEVLEVKGAPISLFTRPRLAAGSKILVGEAAGLVMAWSGEGNRPAINSAKALAEAMGRVGLEDRRALLAAYRDLLKDTIRSAEASRLLLRLLGDKRAAEVLLRLVSDTMWLKYVRQELSPLDILRAFTAL